MLEALDTTIVVATTAILAALIAGLVAMLGHFLSARSNALRLEHEGLALAQKRREFEIQIEARKEELANMSRQLQVQIEDIRQAQFAEIVRLRVAAYSEIYEALQRHNRIWRTAEKPLDHAWAKAFLDRLLDLNAKHGVLFSQDVYLSFSGLRDYIEAIEARLQGGGLATQQELDKIDAWVSGKLSPSGAAREPGLGSHMKDDLGSYRQAAIAARHSALPPL